MSRAAHSMHTRGQTVVIMIKIQLRDGEPVSRCRKEQKVNAKMVNCFHKLPDRIR